jgi:hypothetical protein
MMFVKSASNTIIVTGTPRSHRIPALAIVGSIIYFPGIFNRERMSEFLFRTKI